MADQHAARLDFGQLLAAVEDAPPVAAADVLGERLVQALGAREVSFLIAAFSGHALIRSATPAVRRPGGGKGGRPPRGCLWRELRTAARLSGKRSRSKTAPAEFACMRP